MINEYVENMTEIDRYIYIYKYTYIYNYIYIIIYIRNRCAPGQNIKIGSVLNMLCGSSQSGNEFFDSILYNRLFGAILSCPALLRVLMFRKNCWQGKIKRTEIWHRFSLSLERERQRDRERERGIQKTKMNECRRWVWEKQEKDRTRRGRKKQQARDVCITEIYWSRRVARCGLSWSQSLLLPGHAVGLHWLEECGGIDWLWKIMKDRFYWFDLWLSAGFVCLWRSW